MLKYNIIGVNLNGSCKIGRPPNTNVGLQTRLVLPNNCEIYTAIRLNYPNIIGKKDGIGGGGYLKNASRFNTSTYITVFY